MSRAVRHGRARAAATRAGTVGLCVVAPALVVGLLLAIGGDEGFLAVDFQRAFLPAAQAVVDGVSPYLRPDDPSLSSGAAYVYPPLTAIVLAPLTAVPAAVGAFVFTLLLAAALLGTLALLGVRDWRVYGVVFLWGSTYAALQVGNVTLLLALGAALAWRFRDAPVRFGAAVGGLLAVKLVLWPLGAWALARRQAAAAGWALSVAAAAVLLAWASIGFAGLLDYPALLRRFDELAAPSSYSLYALGLDVGLGDGAARLLWAAVGATLVCSAVLLARRGEERRSFGLAVLAAVACSPIVWAHSFALLVVPIALRSPRLGPLWLVPVPYWLTAGTGNGAPWQTALGLGLAAVVAVWVALPPAALRRERQVEGVPA